MFRGAEETVFFLLSIAENREPTTDARAPVWVYFLQEEAQKQMFQNSRGVCFPGWVRRKEPCREKPIGVQLFVELN